MATSSASFARCTASASGGGRGDHPDTWTPKVSRSGSYAVSRDITERRKLEDSLHARAADLAQADRSKDEFLAMLAHELRNPLAPLRNAAEILRSPTASAETRSWPHISSAAGRET
jgi:signal transduction histidine kinase